MEKILANVTWDFHHGSVMGYTTAERRELIAGLISLLVYSVFYAGIAWALTSILDGGWATFFWTIGILIGIRCAYALIELIVGIIVWRIYQRKIAIANNVEWMRYHELPMRAYSTDDARKYFGRIIDFDPWKRDYSAKVITPELQRLVKEINRYHENVRYEHGALAELRDQDALNRALDVYSPKDNSPPYLFSDVLVSLNDAADEADFSRLPHANSSLVASILDERPFETWSDFYQLLRRSGLNRTQIVDLLVGCDSAHERWSRKT